MSVETENDRSLGNAHRYLKKARDEIQSVLTNQEEEPEYRDEFVRELRELRSHLEEGIGRLHNFR